MPQESRAGRATCLTLDQQAAEALRALVRPKQMGHFVSMLILSEVARREERRKLRGAVLEVLQEASCP